MRKWIFGIGLLVAATAAASAQDARDEIVTGFQGGTTLPAAGDDTIISSDSAQLPGAAPAMHHRRSTLRSRRMQPVVKTPLRPIIIPRPPEPAQPAERVTLWGSVQWGHPLAIGAGLTPVLLAVVLAGFRAARIKKAARNAVPRPPSPRDGGVPAKSGASLAVPAQADGPVAGNSEARIARQFRTGQGAIRLARLIERSPKSAISRMQEFAVRPDDAGGDAGIARNLHVGRGEVRLARRLQQLAGHEQIEGERQ
jgi:hypothetical protein